MKEKELKFIKIFKKNSGEIWRGVGGGIDRHF